MVKETNGNTNTAANDTADANAADLFTLGDRLKALRVEKDDINAELKAVNAEIDKTEKALTEAMVDAECPNFTHGGKQFIMTSTTRWSADTERKEELYAALKEQGYEHLFTVNTQTLGSFVREKAEEYEEENGEDGLPDWLIGLVKPFESVGITMKSAGKKQ